jgi:iron complex transport system substrate-binding protein
MNKTQPFLISLFLFLFLSFLSPTYACSVIDDTGTPLTLSHPAHRLIILSPDLTEHVFALGAEKAIVGVITGSDYPSAAKQIRQVGDYRALDLEAILSLHPDLVLAWGESHTAQIAALKRFSIPVFVSRTEHLKDIPQTMQRLGCLLGKETEAKQLKERFFRRYAELKKKYQNPSSSVSVFYQLAAHPLITINQGSWITEAINLCGGNNIFAQEGLSPLKQKAFAVSTEAVIRANPEVIVADLPSGWQKPWQAWPFLAAVKNQRLISIKPDLLERAGPRILEGVGQLCQALHPSLSSKPQKA